MFARNHGVERETLQAIFDDTYNRLVEAGERHEITDHDAIINAVLTFVERIIPKILGCYKGEDYEHKCNGIATSLRVTIWSIMPWPKFLAIMQRPEMKAIDEIVQELDEKGSVDISDEQTEALFKHDNASNIYG